MSGAGGAAAVVKTEKRAVNFHRGLPGLEGCRQFVLSPLPESELFMLLSAAEDENVALILVDPLLFFPEYRFELCAADRRELKVRAGEEELFTYTTVALVDHQLYTNLAAPLVINMAEGLGRQLIIPEAMGKLRAPLTFG
jgi:flagellar assembly factor FliW